MEKTSRSMRDASVTLLTIAFLLCCIIGTDCGASETQEYEKQFSDKSPPHFLQPCHKKHKRFNLCVKTSLQALFASVIHGSQELDIPPIEPLYVPEINISEGSGDVALDLKFHHVSIRGLGETKVIAVRSNLEDYKFEITLKYPYMNFTGDFTGQGQVKTLPIVGEGQFYFNMSDVSAAWIIYLSPPEEGRDFYKIDNFIIDIIPVEIAGKFGSAIDGDSSLGDTINGFFNENAQEIFKVAKPKITEALAQIVTRIADRMLRKISADEMLPQ